MKVFTILITQIVLQSESLKAQILLLFQLLPHQSDERLLPPGEEEQLQDEGVEQVVGQGDEVILDGHSFRAFTLSISLSERSLGLHIWHWQLCKEKHS